MKLNKILLAVALAAAALLPSFALAQDIDDNLGSTPAEKPDATVPQTPPPAPAATPAVDQKGHVPYWETRQGVEHAAKIVFAGLYDHRGDYRVSTTRRQAGSTRRVAAARKSKEATVPNVVINNNFPAQSAKVGPIGLKDPNRAPAGPVDPESAIKAGYGYTTATTDGWSSVRLDPPSAGPWWLWPLIAFLAIAALLALVASIVPARRAVAPAPAPAPAAPAVGPRGPRGRRGRPGRPGPAPAPVVTPAPAAPAPLPATPAPAVGAGGAHGGAAPGTTPVATP